MTMARDEEILHLARQGIEYQEIATKFGLSKARVSQICVREGFVKRISDVNIENIKNRAAFSQLLSKMAGENIVEPEG